MAYQVREEEEHTRSLRGMEGGGLYLSVRGAHLGANDTVLAGALEGDALIIECHALHHGRRKTDRRARRQGERRESGQW